MKLEIKDTPGQLVAALTPISDLGGNIIAVIHQRDPSVKTDTLDVQIMLELPDQKLNELIEKIQEQGVEIVRIGEERLLIRRSVILIGHLMHTDLADTVDQIDATGFAEIGELSMLMPSIEEKSSAKITIKSDSEADIQKALLILHDVARKKDILIIEPLEEKC